MKVVGAFDAAGIELISESTPSIGQGRGVRLKERAGVKTAMPSPGPGRKKRGLLRPSD
jgi:hypothetical protein